MLIVLILSDQAAASLLFVNFCIQDLSFFSPPILTKKRCVGLSLCSGTLEVLEVFHCYGILIKVPSMYCSF